MLAAIGVAGGLQWTHFVGATPDGRIAVYQGVPFEITADTPLYRAVEITDIPIALLGEDERRALLDQRLGSRASTEARIAPLLASPWLRQPSAS